MTVETNFTPAAIMEMGYQRIKSIADRHGINSPEVLSACERWGGILDDVNYPDSTCSRCGHPVTHAWEGETSGVWYHTDTKSKHCRAFAASVATPVPTVADYNRAKVTGEPVKATGWQLGDSEPVERKVIPEQALPLKPRTPRKLKK